MKINFGALEKDRAGLDTGLLTIAKNCYPNTIGWGPMPSLAASGSGALPARCIGLWFVRSKTGAYQVFAATATRLYKLVSGVWTNYTRAVGGDYATVAGAVWQGAQYGSLFMVVNASDEPQVIDIEDGSVAFSDMLGSPPVSKYIGIVGDFVFLVDATNLRRAINCGTTGPNTATSWTVGTDLCDEYIAPDGGNIATAPLLGEYGLVMQTEGIARRVILQPGDPDAAFRFEKIEGIKGAVSGYSVIAANGQVYYPAEDGIYSLSPSGANTPIGAQRINRDFRENSDQARLEQIIGFADPYSSRIYWAFYSSPAATNYDRLLGYDWLLDRLFFVEAEAQFWAPVAVPATTLEGLSTDYPSIDAMTISLDSRMFQGGRPTIGAIDSSSKLALLAGPDMTAVLRVSAVHLVPTMRALLTEVYPMGEWGTATVTLRIGKRELPGSVATWVGPFSMSSETGTIYPHVSSRLHEFEITIAGGGWTHAQSLGTKEQADGYR